MKDPLQQSDKAEDSKSRKEVSLTQHQAFRLRCKEKIWRGDLGGGHLSSKDEAQGSIPSSKKVKIIEGPNMRLHIENLCYVTSKKLGINTTPATGQQNRSTLNSRGNRIL